MATLGGSSQNPSPRSACPPAGRIGAPLQCLRQAAKGVAGADAEHGVEASRSNPIGRVGLHPGEPAGESAPVGGVVRRG